MSPTFIQYYASISNSYYMIQYTRSGQMLLENSSGGHRIMSVYIWFETF